MNRIIFISLLILSMCLVGCGQNAKKVVVQEVKEPLLKEFLNNFVAQNPNYKDNIITREEAGKKFAEEWRKVAFGDSIPYISPLPMILEELDPIDQDQYAVAFRFGDPISHMIVGDYDVLAVVCAVISKDVAVKLKEKGEYHIKGSCHSFVNENNFDYYSSSISEEPMISWNGDMPLFNFGMLYVENLTFTEFTEKLY